MNLSNLDPNLVAGIFTLLGTLGGWLYNKARGKKTQDLTELLDEAITAEVLDAVEDGETLDTIEDRLTNTALLLSKKLGVKLSASVARIAVQYGVVEFRQAVKKREAAQKAVAQMQTQLDKLATEAAKVGAAFTDAPTIAIPKLQFETEIIK